MVAGECAMSEEWIEVAHVSLPESTASLSDEELEEFRVYIENACTVEFLRVVGGDGD